MAKKTKRMQQLIARERLRPPKNLGYSVLMFLAYVAYLRAMRLQFSPETKVLRTLIVVVGLVLTVVALVVAGKPNMVPEVLKYLPSIP